DPISHTGSAVRFSKADRPRTRAERGTKGSGAILDRDGRSQTTASAARSWSTLPGCVRTLFAAPALSEGGHGSLARLRIAVGWPAVAVIAKGERPEPRRSYRRSHGFHDAPDHDVAREHVVVVLVPFPRRTAC